MWLSIKLKWLIEKSVNYFEKYDLNLITKIVF